MASTVITLRPSLSPGGERREGGREGGREGERERRERGREGGGEGEKKQKREIKVKQCHELTTNTTCTIYNIHNVLYMEQ